MLRSAALSAASAQVAVPRRRAPLGARPNAPPRHAPGARDPPTPTRKRAGQHGVRHQMKAPARPGVAPADPSLWSEKTQRSVVAAWTKEYRDIAYRCWPCRAHALFTVQDQKYTLEVRKAPIDQRRSLCHDCWRKSLEIARALKMFEERWREEKLCCGTTTTASRVGLNSW
jgi:hypothetical protein